MNVAKNEKYISVTIVSRIFSYFGQSAIETDFTP